MDSCVLFLNLFTFKLSKVVPLFEIYFIVFMYVIRNNLYTKNLLYHNVATYRKLRNLQLAKLAKIAE